MTHASESSCPIVLREFALNDGDRALFNGLDSSVTPLSEGVETFSVATTFDETYIQRSVSVSLNPASKNLFISINGNFCDYNQATDQCNSYSDLQIDRLDIQLPDGSVSSLEASAANTILPSDCAWYAGEDDIGLCGSNTLIFPYDVPIAGSYKITANIWPRIGGNDDPRSRSLSISVGAESTAAPKQSTANGVIAIKQKLVELHHELFGESYTINAPEISLAYDLFVESWDETRNLPNAIWDYSSISWGPDITCNVRQDYEVGVGLPTDISPFILQDNDWGSGPFPSVRLSDEMGEYLGQAGSDPRFTKRAWVTVMAYMLSHYDYLYE
jgi:hypothetical protein